jgi:serine/threonine-protein kinase
MSLLQTVGRYEIVSELGRGAMGVVYKAKDPTIGRTVALKTTRLDVSGLDGGEMLRRFQNEARAAGLLSHPNIVTIYDAGQQDGNFYIAMELIEGTTLQELMLQRHILPTEEVVHLAREICKGLDYAHAHGIIHRDVKPANIMITARGAVKIMDFGIAKSGGSMTSTGQVLGTPNYMSPEQVRGRPLDGRSDLFSLGVILYEMLTGEKPFVGQNVTTIIYKIVNETQIAPRDLDVTIHPGLSAIVARLLAKSPDERYQSGADLIHDLESYRLAGAALHASTTAVLPPAAPHEKTAVLPMRVVAGSAVRVAAPEAATVMRPVPLQKQGGRSSHRNTIFVILLSIVLLGTAMGSYAYYRTRIKMQQLEAQIKSDELKAAHAAKPKVEPTPAAVSAPAADQPSPAPSPEVTPGTEDQIAPDTTVKLNSLHKGLKTGTPTLATLQGELIFSSRPDGAKVLIDGAGDPAWVTPFKASHIAAGTHDVVFSKDGYVQQSRTVELKPGRVTPVSVLLTQVSRLAVSSNPLGASVWLDGKDTGLVTPTQLTLDQAPHRVTVRKTGYKEVSTDTSLVVGQTLSFSPILLSLDQHTEDGPSNNFFHKFLGSDTIPEGKGLIHVRTVPEGATIIVDGRVAPKKSNSRWSTEPGVHSVVLQMSGYRSEHYNIQVRQGRIKNIDAILQKQ